MLLLVTVLGELSLCLLVNLGVLLCVGKLPLRSLLALVVRGALDFSPLLESVYSSAIRATSARACLTDLSTTSLYFQPNS